MMQVLEFVFSGFWTFAGCLVLLSVVCECLVKMTRVICRRSRRVTLNPPESAKP